MVTSGTTEVAGLALTLPPAGGVAASGLGAAGAEFVIGADGCVGVSEFFPQPARARTAKEETTISVMFVFM